MKTCATVLLLLATILAVGIASPAKRSFGFPIFAKVRERLPKRVPLIPMHLNINRDLESVPTENNVAFESRVLSGLQEMTTHIYGDDTVGISKFDDNLDKDKTVRNKINDCLAAIYFYTSTDDFFPTSPNLGLQTSESDYEAGLLDAIKLIIRNIYKGDQEGLADFNRSLTKNPIVLNQINDCLGGLNYYFLRKVKK